LVIESTIDRGIGQIGQIGLPLSTRSWGPARVFVTLSEWNFFLPHIPWRRIDTAHYTRHCDVKVFIGLWLFNKQHRIFLCGGLTQSPALKNHSIFAFFFVWIIIITSSFDTGLCRLCTGLWTGQDRTGQAFENTRHTYNQSH
jgi:hypothetical protein